MTAYADLPPDARHGIPALRALLADAPGWHLADRVDALRARLAALDDGTPSPEAWNAAFGPGTLFDAWTRNPLAEALFDANRATLRPWIDGRPDWVVIEVGGGDGRLWTGLLTPEDRGTLVVVDPHPEPASRLADALHAGGIHGVAVHAVRRGVEAATLPAADAIVCSLTLHHLAGVDGRQRALHGLGGPGKAEVLARFARALTPRRGLLLLNEADVDCELDLRPGDPTLRHHLADSYVRRCASALLDAIDASDDPSLRRRWWAIVRRWCLDQLDLAHVPAAQRDVYELSVPRWLGLLHAAGLSVRDHRFTDDRALFHRYLAVPAQAWRAARAAGTEPALVG